MVSVLELLVFINDLDAMIILLLCGFLADVGEMAIHCHYGWSSWMSVVNIWPISLW